MNKKIQLGDKIPAFTAKDQNGQSWSDKDLLGKITIFYFYPKDDTPGCTLEACAFRDNFPDFSKIGIQILGISPDDAASHQKFIQKHGLNFNLLTDENRSLCNTFSVLEDKSLTRTTFLVDDQGIIRWIEKPVKVEGHVGRLKEAIETL